jgi:hypothetical protein
MAEVYHLFIKSPNKSQQSSQIVADCEDFRLFASLGCRRIKKGMLTKPVLNNSIVPVSAAKELPSCPTENKMAPDNKCG